MTQVVYCGYLDNTYGIDLEPLSDHIDQNIFNNPSDRKTSILACPAFKQTIKNVFVVKSTYQYGIEWDGTHIKSPYYDQPTFNRFVKVRSASTGFISYRNIPLCLTSESDDLDITLEPAYFHDNDITRNCYTIPGTFNIGKHLPRPLELPFKFKKPSYIKINENDAVFYVRFHTDEKIVFKKFIFSTELKEVIKGRLSGRPFTQGFKDLQWWYDLVRKDNLKKYCLKEIKKNLL